MPVTYTNARVFTGDGILEESAVTTDYGIVTSILPAAAVESQEGTVVDLQGAILAPAMIDLQIYGGNGAVFSLYPSVASLTAVVDYSKAGGAALVMPTVATISPEIMLEAIHAVKAYWEQGGKGVAGLHLEGPFINPAKKGAHLPQYIRKPAQEDIDWIITHGKGIVKIMTLAPECCDPILIRQLQEAGIVVFAGHSNATYDQAYIAFEQGIRHATHLFNAMSPLESRAPGIVGAIYDHPAVSASIVADGVHVDFAAIRISKKIMGERLFLITDAVEENKTGPYTYLREQDRFVSATGVLSGSRLTMIQAVRNCVEQVGISLEEALRMASLYPARAIGQAQQRGRIKPGYAAALVAIRPNWEVTVYCE
ncbi:N-acetylglucosamine-6-phosphate deacetylase [Chitinophaga nivalis]|uniref:N-acetylglucosamine-6-phosphate deacetylase n=1 Tax=Chitinophaga nivalis TaxID=2991709 RepID=A0ABT3IW13_9BACT|nr:N-acetylglucosamine-6-phosphate deacetylase [Chitinophaga nivalis]MCW3462141.1 N-acetylglucosamine-6-phosphate deacetylase [Chitinophaga nivalis]MCW3488167.1 N-acetylglucosamine-6-phosphate deacetylase [Chitinophaga nivalis]